MINKLIILLMASFVTLSCSSTPEMETTEDKTLKLLTETLKKQRQKNKLIDVRTILTREQIDNANMPVLMVELPSGQNGTLTQYPGTGLGTTWLGIDGATLTLQNGVIIASRGMGDDVMGGVTGMPNWKSITEKSYSRSLSYLVKDNVILTRNFYCQILDKQKTQTFEFFDVKFVTNLFEETCKDEVGVIENSYFIDKDNIVRNSYQFHSPSIGYLKIHRVDR